MISLEEKKIRLLRLVLHICLSSLCNQPQILLKRLYNASGLQPQWYSKDPQIILYNKIKMLHLMQSNTSRGKS